VPDAYDDAVRALARRPLARSEVERRLRQRGHEAAAIDAALVKLESSGVIDDAALARQYIDTRAVSRGRGRDRTVAELIARGVDRETAESAWRDAVGDGAIDDGTQLARAVTRRLGPPSRRVDRARLARVYNALLSEGFERGAVEAALVSYGLERNDS
jgi:regulatory protein